jgi:hypothetical protein
MASVGAGVTGVWPAVGAGRLAARELCSGELRRGRSG